MPAKTPSKSPRKPKYEDWITDVVTRLTGELNLSEWRIELSYDESDDNPDCIAFANIDTRYLTAYVGFTDKARGLWDEGELRILAECTTHELTHILLEPLHKFARRAASPQTESQLTDLLEQANQRIARVVIAQLPPKFFSL